MDRWEKKINIDIIEEKNLLPIDSEISEIIQKLQSFNFFNLKTVEYLTVPQKRKRVKALLDSLIYISKHRTDIFNSKLDILKKVKQYWMEGKNIVIITVRKSAIVKENDIKLKKSITFPKQTKIAGRPKHALKTFINTTSKKKKQKSRINEIL